MSDPNGLVSEPLNDLYESLEDVRFCGFKVFFKLREIFSAENDFYYFINDEPARYRAKTEIIKLINDQYNKEYCNGDQKTVFNRLYLTPQFMPHFDIRGVRDYTMIYNILNYAAINLGFALRFT